MRTFPVIGGLACRDRIGYIGFVHPLKRYRRENGLSQAALARLLRVSRVTVARWEIGERYPDEHLVPLIAEKTGVPPRDLRPDLAVLFDDRGRP